MGELNFCVLADIIKSAWTEVTIDIPVNKGLPFVLIRFLHNKLFALSFFSLRCYFLYFDTDHIVNFIPFFLLPFILLAFLLKPLRKVLWIIQLLFPIAFIVNPLHLSLGARISLFTLYYIGMSLIGLLKVIRVLIKKQAVSILFSKVTGGRSI